MNYNQAKSKYLKMKIENPLPPLPEDERIYLNVTYKTRDYAKYVHCSFDSERKLWFTGVRNRFIETLVEFYGVNDATSEKARSLLKSRLDADKEDRLLREKTSK